MHIRWTLSFMRLFCPNHCFLFLWWFRVWAIIIIIQFIPSLGYALFKGVFYWWQTVDFFLANWWSPFSCTVRTDFMRSLCRIVYMPIHLVPFPITSSHPPQIMLKKSPFFFLKNHFNEHEIIGRSWRAMKALMVPLNTPWNLATTTQLLKWGYHISMHVWSCQENSRASHIRPFYAIQYGITYWNEALSGRWCYHILDANGGMEFLYPL